MYFFNRNEAGRMLAELIYNDLSQEQNAVMALSPGSVLVAQEIAKRLNCPITMLVMKDIVLPGLDMTSIGILDHEGDFTYNDMFSAGQLEELVSEFYQHIELEKMTKMHEMNQIIGKDGVLDRHVMAQRNVIVVSDGLRNGASFDAAAVYLKPVATRRVIAAVPFTSIDAIDRLHIASDAIYCLDVKANYLDTDHYYEDNYIPDNDEINKIIKQIDIGDPLKP